MNTDHQTSSVGLNGNLGPLGASITLSRFDDNLAHDRSRPTNRAPALVFGLNAPLAQLLAAQTPSRWWPTLQYDLSRQRNDADPAYVPTGLTADA